MSQELQEDKKQTIKVNIYGQEYPIRSDADAAYVQQIAEYVDRKMKEVAEKVPARIHSQLAVLTALHIADEFFKEREDKEKKLSEVEEKTQSLIEWLDAKLIQE
ncbi:MAG: cell division protein ZapA [candidate division Zixibacteria bacterium]|jgi:cell division protein ZapA|nr:cell division protein ZapA [candidate division Zixibacteria bacterium]